MPITQFTNLICLGREKLGDFDQYFFEFNPSEYEKSETKEFLRIKWTNLFADFFCNLNCNFLSRNLFENFTF